MTLLPAGEPAVTHGELALNSTPVFSLTLFGTPRLTHADGSPLTGRVVQRHRIGLLALLAAAHPRGRGRESLMAALWPEHDTDSARKLLNQSVYVIRKALGDDAIVSQLDELRLGEGSVTVDVIEFEASVRAGSYARAVALYAGPFLDGFFVTGSAELEEWVSGERSRLGALYAKALEGLAEEAEAAGDPGAAADWWKARVVHDPYDSEATIRLMTVLEAAGNRAGALQQARIHEQLLQDEFGIAPSEELLALSTRLRSAPPAPHADPPTDSRAVEPAEPPISERSMPGVPGAPIAGSRLARWLPLRVGAGVLILALLVFGAVRMRSVGNAESQLRPSIAVLPLDHLGSDPADAPLAAGMTEEIVMRLAQMQGLRVAGGSAVRSLVDRGVDLRGVADSLRVDHILEGGLQKIGPAVRVRLRLVDARDGATRWSHTYDGVMGDVFAFHDQIARNVAGELGVRLTGSEVPGGRGPGTRNVAAYEHYLRGSDRALLRSDSGSRAALEHFRRAVSLDSSYAAAWAGLGRLYGRLAITRPRDERHRYTALSREAVERAIALDDSLAEAHATLGIALMRTFEFTAAERHLRRALELDPGRALTHEWLVTLSLWTGRPEQALGHARRAVELEPLSPSAHAELARALAGNDRCPEALQELAALHAVRPPLLRVPRLAALCHARLEQWDSAIALIRPAAESSRKVSLPLLGFLLARAGHSEEALRIRTEVMDSWRRGDLEAFDVALQFAGSGDADEAFIWLDRALDDQSLTGLPGDAVPEAVMGPLFAHLHDDVRFAELRRRMGLQKP